MMSLYLSRRGAFRALASAYIAAQLPAEAAASLQIGVMDGVLGLASNPESVALAARLGLAGVQVTLGQPQASGELLLSDTHLQQRFVEAAKKYRISLPNTYLDVLHRDCLKNNSAQALHWIREGLIITQALNAKVLMLVFFGKCAIEKEPEQREVIEPLKEACRMAEDAGITLGFENTISAQSNIAILDAVNSSALKVWYDIGNSTNIGHFDVPEEIRLLGRERICAFHIKDKGYLDTGAVRVRDALKAIREIDFRGYAMLETTAPSGNRVDDLRRNLEILKRDLVIASEK